MFTGLITDVGHVRAVEQKGDLRLVIGCGYDMAGIDLGASIACSGVCLTVVDKGDDWFAVDVSAETLNRTAAGLWQEGARLNLERSLRLGDELGGHIVTGHVDGVGEIEAVAEVGGSTRVTIVAPPIVEAYVAAKGSIALDGVSLTVNEVEPISDGVRFAINIIPHTAERTTFSALAPGRPVNIEIDILARYIGRMMELRR
ncbi:riboflavin synthase [Sphingomonas parva]|uniref:Riboflavin synthase n=1 Tax=Sphingomonas parva TaxID=2555898 RepID=A0A4Y8ZQ48_9SPHN|nr:riboflavin synthase [Sphingomonas parva]TFI57265.1 riboflavin synthase [Sphingomonas parva]